MAKILLGASVGDARGSVGAHVFSKNQFGSYIRQKVSPVQPRTARQMHVRGLFALLSTRWANILTDTQRAGWKSLAQANPTVDVFGNQQILSGLQYFERVNRNLQEVGVAPLDASPGNQDVTPLTIGVIQAKVAGTLLNFAFTPTPMPAGDHIVAYATPLLNQGVTFFKPKLKLAKADQVGALVSPFEFGVDWVTLFGPLVAGQRIGMAAFVVRAANGAASATVYGNTIVVA